MIGIRWTISTRIPLSLCSGLLHHARTLEPPLFSFSSSSSAPSPSSQPLRAWPIPQGPPTRSRCTLGFVTDIGTFDKGTAERVFPAKRAYSPYAGRNLPDPPALRRHPSPHDVLLRCRRLRRAALPERCLSLCQGRGNHRVDRDNRRSCHGRWISWSSPITPTIWASFRRCSPEKPDVLADPTGRNWYDMIQSGQGADAAIEMIIAFSQGTFPQALYVAARNAGLPGRLAGNHQGRRGSQRSRPLHRVHRL